MLLNGEFSFNVEHGSNVNTIMYQATTTTAIAVAVVYCHITYTRSDALH